MPTAPAEKPRTFDAEEYVLIDPRVLGDEEPAPAAGKVQVVVGKELLFVVTPDGALYGMGVNWFGQLGLAELIKRDLTMILPGGVRQVVGEEHTLIVMRDGSLWGMGRNQWGQLGLGVVEPLERFQDKNASQKSPEKLRPRRIVDGGVVKAAASRATSMFLKEDGSLWAMGSNVAGALGVGNPAGLNSVGTLGPEEWRKVWFLDRRDEKTPKQVEKDGVVDVAMFNGVGYYLKEDGSLWATGLAYDRKARLFDPKAKGIMPVKVDDGPIRMAVGGNQNLVWLRKDGSLWGIGQNRGGILSVGDDSPRDKPVRIVEDGVVDMGFSMAGLVYLTEDGSVWFSRYRGGYRRGEKKDGEGPDSRPKKVAVSDVVDVGLHTAVWMKTAEGAFLGLGENTSGQLTGEEPGKYDYGTSVKKPIRVTPEQVHAVLGNAVASVWVTREGELMTLGWYPQRSMARPIYFTGKAQSLFPNPEEYPQHPEPRRLMIPARMDDVPSKADSASEVQGAGNDRAASEANPLPLLDEAAQRRWYVVNDNVMGGRSKGGFRFEKGRLIFSGETNTTGGGFSSIRTPLPKKGMLKDASGIELRIRNLTPGRRFQIGLYQRRKRAGIPVVYRGAIELDDDSKDWQTVRIPFASLQPTWLGRPVKGAVRPKEMHTFDFYIYDKEDGEFRAEVSAIGWYRAPDKE